MKKLIQKNEGFTLIELMIVVVIIGILAAVAVPQFLKYQLKSKTTEASRNIGAIKTNQEAFAAKWSAYVGASDAPDGRTPDADKAAWKVKATNQGFDLLGFAPSGQVYYVYGVAAWNAGDITSQMTANSCTLTGATTETTIGLSGGKPSPQNGINRTNGQDNIQIIAKGDLDADGVISCFVMNDYTGELIPAPGASGENIF